MSHSCDLLNSDCPGRRTVVSIRRSLWKRAALIVAALFCLIGGPFLGLDPRSVASWAALICSIGLLVLFLPYLLGLSMLPLFVVREDGIQHPTNLWLLWNPGFMPTMGNWRSLGLCTWDKVGGCRWSRYTPGLLVVQIAVTQADGKPTNSAGRFECRIPEPDRPAGEKAIRSMGRWSDGQLATGDGIQVSYHSSDLVR